MVLTAVEVDRMQWIKNQIGNAFFKALYEQEINYWNARLQKLSDKNCKIQGRTKEYTIYFRGTVWTPINHESPTPAHHPKYTLQLPDDHPEMIQEMEIIAEELSKLKDEIQEATRFINGLLSFNLPPKMLEKILGETLYATCKDIVLQQRVSSITWDGNPLEQHSLDTFLATQSFIIQNMKSRVLSNFISLDDKK